MKWFPWPQQDGDCEQIEDSKMLGWNGFEFRLWYYESHPDTEQYYNHQRIWTVEK